MHPRLHQSVVLVEKGRDLIEEVVKILPRDGCEDSRGVAVRDALMGNHGVDVLPNTLIVSTQLFDIRPNPLPVDCATVA